MERKTRMIHETKGSCSTDVIQYKTHASGGLSHTQKKLKAFDGYVYKATGFGKKTDASAQCVLHFFWGFTQDSE